MEYVGTDGQRVAEKKTEREPNRDAFENAAVGGVRVGEDFEDFTLAADLDFARYNSQPKTWIDLYSLTTLVHYPWIKRDQYSIYSGVGGSFKMFDTHVEVIEENEEDFAYNIDFEAMESFNGDLVVGAKYRPIESLVLNVEYKYSDTLASNGNWARSSSRGRDENGGTIRASNRIAFEDFRATVQELALFATWTL
jgi:opacity protein-like surface antigen